MGGKIYDVVCMSIHTTCGMNAHLYHIVGLYLFRCSIDATILRCSMLDAVRTVMQ